MENKGSYNNRGFGNVEAIAFTDRGEKLARRIMEELDGNCRASRSGMPEKLKEWTAGRFFAADGLVFVGAVGIAVRAIAPYVKDKTEDPAVVVVDEAGRYVIPVLSGHLGGANRLAEAIAELIGAQAVITTATDIRGVFAVDQWAAKQGCLVLEPEKIKIISSGLLAGESMSLRSPWDIGGDPPRGIVMTDEMDSDIALDIRPLGVRPIHIIPRICILGVGCRKGVTASRLEEFFRGFIREAGIYEEAILAAASIDIKAEEKGLLEFCEDHRWELRTYSSSRLMDVHGDFSSSDFVKDITGVDNVCERSAVLSSGGGMIIKEKCTGEGITMALAQMDFSPDWRWQNE